MLATSMLMSLKYHLLSYDFQMRWNVYLYILALVYIILYVHSGQSVLTHTRIHNAIQVVWKKNILNTKSF